MLYMLDTDIASYIIKGRGGLPIVQRLDDLSPSDVCVSVMTQAELLFGLKKVGPNPHLEFAVKKFLRSVRVLPWKTEGAEFYAEIRYGLARGETIGEMDMLIAAHAIAVDAVLVTNNTRHFSRIKMPMMMENWME